MFLPSRHMKLIQHRLNVDATSWRCIDVEPTLYKRRMPAGYWLFQSGSSLSVLLCLCVCCFTCGAVVSRFVLHLFFLWCLGKAVLRDYCISWISSLIFLDQYDKALTLKTPKNLHLKMSSVYVVCWIFLQTFQTYFLHTGKQCGPWSDCS